MAISENIHCLKIPMWQQPLLLPNTAVAELINFEPLEGESDQHWFLGEINWRGMFIPVINLEEDTSNLDNLDRNVRIAILNTSNGNPEQPFVGILVKGLPKLSHVENEMLEFDDEHEADPLSISRYFKLNDELIRIPNIDILEEMAQTVAL